jgi:hemolysin activation/secretion protein
MSVSSCRQVCLAASVVALLLALTLTPCSAAAQAAPRSGELNQQIQTAPPPIAPPPSQPLPTLPATPQTSQEAEGTSQRFPVRGIRFIGNKSVSSAELSAHLPRLNPAGSTLSELQALANAVSAYYRAKGYPLARAYLPRQRSHDGEIEVLVVEGRFGRVALANTSGVRGKVLAGVLHRNLCPTSPDDCADASIRDAPLQRATLLLSDLPGVSVSSALKTGQTQGTADLDVAVATAPRLTGVAGGDNYGAGSTGSARGSVAVQLNEPLGIGDALGANLSGSGKIWDGGVNYSAAVGDSGLRAGASADHTHYLLGGQFVALGASGTADIFSGYLSYPVIRSVADNMTLGLSYARKQLNDQVSQTGADTRASIDDLALSASGNWLDDLGGGGSNRYSFAWTRGWLHNIDAASFAADQTLGTGLFTEGAFDKFNLDVQRQQKIVGGFSFYAGATGQYASKNLVDTVSAGLVGVCRTGREVHEHIDQGLFGRLGLPGWMVANSTEEYVAAAVRLVDDQDERLRLRRELIAQQSVSRLFAGRPEIFGERVLALLGARVPA